MAAVGRRAAGTLVESGSRGEGPNHSNYSDQSSVRVRSEFLESVENHENQNLEKATNDPLYKKGPQKNREEKREAGGDKRGLVASR